MRITLIFLDQVANSKHAQHILLFESPQQIGVASWSCECSSVTACRCSWYCWRTRHWFWSILFFLSCISTSRIFSCWYIVWFSFGVHIFSAFFLIVSFLFSVFLAAFSLSSNSLHFYSSHFFNPLTHISKKLARVLVTHASIKSHPS